MLTVLASLLTHLLWASVAVYAVRSFCALVQSSPSRTTVESEPTPEIPEDLMALAMSHRDAWAQEDTIRVITEKYDDLKDWNRVRAAMNIGRIDG